MSQVINRLHTNSLSIKCLSFAKIKLRITLSSGRQKWGKEEMKRKIYFEGRFILKEDRGILL